MQPGAAFSVGGTVQASGGIYITRPADEELFRLCMEGTYAHVLTSRQMGKSSLRVAVSERLRREGMIRIASIDLTSIGTQADSAEQWYVSVLEKVEEDLRLTTSVLDWWEAHEHLTPTDRFIRYLLEVALAQVDGRVVIFVDEIDSTLSLPFSGDDFFAAVRSLFNARAEIPDARRLCFVLIGSAAPGDLIRNPSRTPFNIGRGVTLTDFTEEGAQPLAAAIDAAGGNRRELLHRIFEWTGGHPYLTQRLCMAVTGRPAAQADFDGLVRQTFLVSGDKKDSNLEWVRDMLTERAPDREAVLTTWRDVLRGRRVMDQEASVAKAHLKLTGVVRPVDSRLEPHNRIYTTAFDEAWVLRHLPQDLERQRRLARYRRLASVAGGAALFLALVGIAMGVLLSRARQAEADATAAKTSATQERDKAVDAKSDAVREQRRAEAALREAEAQRQAALNEQRRAEAAAMEARARQLAAQAEFLRVRPGQLTLGSLLALESVQRLPLIENRSAIGAALDVAGRARAHIRHQSPVNAVAISPDGKWLVTASGKTARIWYATTGRERARLDHQDSITAVAISPDGKWLATAGDDSAARIWEASTGREIAHLQHRDKVEAVAISPDGKWLVTASADKTAGIWESSTGRRLANLPHRGSVSDVSISSNGKWLVTASGDKTARIWDANTGRELARLEHQQMVYAVAISPDGKWLATTSGGGKGMVGFLVGALTGGSNSTRMWEVPSGRELARIEYYSSVNAVAISPDGNWLATASADTTARIWDADTGRELARLEHQGAVDGVAISPDGKWLVTTSQDKTARIWNTSTGRELARLEHENEVNAVAISPGGKWLATASNDKTVRMWDASTGRERARFEHQNRVRAVAISSDGKWIATASDDKTARTWDASTGRERTRLEHKTAVNAVAIGPDGKWLVTGGGTFAIPDYMAHVWDAASGRERARLEHKNFVNAVAVSPDGSWLVTMEFSGMVRTWDAADARELGRFEARGIPSRMAISPDGQWLATTGVDNRVRIWNVSTGRERPGLEHKAGLNAVAISPDGKWLATTSMDNTARIWNASTGRELAGLEHQAGLNAVAISPDGKWLATTSSDKAARIWDASTHREYVRLQFTDAPGAVAFTPDGRLLAIAHGNTVTLEPWRAEDLVQDLCSRMTRNLTFAEWSQYIGNEPYRRTCPNLPGPEQAKEAGSQ